MNTKNKTILFALILLGLLLHACNDEFDKHYDRSGSLPSSDENLYHLIKQNEDLSKFTKLVEIAGYDTLLSATQTFTVWAPVNESLSDIDLNVIDRKQARLIVGNHIARFNNSTSTNSDKSIRMIDNKVYHYSDGGLSFGGSKLIKHDILAKNGVIHTIESQIPYHENLYEYIFNNSNTSKLSDFISSFSEERFNEILSIPIDIDENGRTVYDTVTTSYNRLFDNRIFSLGHINVEDSAYTMLIPTNDAWDAAYTRIFPYYTVQNANQAYADSVQHVQTSLAVLSDLIYRSKMENPSVLDSIVSTSGSVIHNPADLFGVATTIQASNGLIFLTNDLRYDNTETWNKNIIVEAENTKGRTSAPNSNVYTREVTNSSPIPVSNLRYIEVQPANAGAQPSVTFEIPDILSGKYDVYIEFIPASIDGNPRDSTKLMFDITYMQPNGRLGNKTVNTANLVTSGTKKVKMKAFSEFEFPVSNYYDRLWQIDLQNGLHIENDKVVTTKLMIKTNVSASDLNNNVYTRKFRVDKIIFESARN